MNNVHGIIYAYHGFAELRELGTHRTGSSLPFCGRYRLIDFALSAMMHAGIHDVGVIMQRDYQSLMDHLGSGRTWDMSRRTGGMRLLPPYGLPNSQKGLYEGCMEALGAVRSYLGDIKQEYVVLHRGDLCANIDLESLVARHIASGADVTAVCTTRAQHRVHHRYVVGPDGFVEQLLCRQTQEERGVASLEVYVMRKQRLLELVDWCAERSRLHFHRDAMTHLLSEGGRVAVYMHDEWSRMIVSVNDYYEASMDMLDERCRRELFDEARYITTRERMDASTYYADGARVRNSLIADGCIIEGDIENSVIFCGVKCAPGAVLRNCIVMNDTVIGTNARLGCIISDKNVKISPYVTLTGNEKLPLVIPKESEI